VIRDDDRNDFLILSGGGCNEGDFGGGVGGFDDGGEGGKAGCEDRFMERLSRLSSATSSIREHRFR
jgi:hypothetical protein